MHFYDRGTTHDDILLDVGDVATVSISDSFLNSLAYDGNGK